MISGKLGRIWKEAVVAYSRYFSALALPEDNTVS
jgi:hypothetical protein